MLRAARTSRSETPHPAALLILLALVAPAVAHAEDETGSPAAPGARTVWFGGLDWGRSGFAALGAKRALVGPLDQDGPVAMGTIGYGGEFDRVDRPGRPLGLTHTVLASALVGYQWMFPWGAVAAFAGPETSYEFLPDFDPGERRRSRTRLGARVQGEVWARPTADTLLVANLILGSARQNAWGRIAWGYRAVGDVYLGPEVSAYATDTYRKGQIGIHATGFEISGLSLRLSGGWQREGERGRNGPYLGLSGHISR